jgi:hypothetical protein
VTWKLASDVVWVLIAAAVVGVALRSHRSATLATCGEAVRRLVARPAPRVIVLLIWMWLGWHSFAR